jgi:hydrogenase maturation protease
MKTLVLGLGNPILTDDGVGIHVVRALAADGCWDQPLPAYVHVTEASVGGLRLLDVLAGVDRAILVDAIQTPGGQPGEIYHLGLHDLRSTLHSGSTHDLTLPGALALGRRLEIALPPEEAITIVAIEAEDVLTFSEGCTPAVEAALPRAVDAVLAELGLVQGGPGESKRTGEEREACA